MPNWVKHKITITGNENSLRDLMDRVRTSDSEFDFNGIVPMPKSLDIEEGSRTDKGESLYRAFLSLIEQGVKADEAKAIVIEGDEDNAKTFELGRTAVANEHLYGARSWYDWCCYNWGTKWNACEPYVDYTGGDYCEIDFDTAWSASIPIFEKMHEIYPDLEIVVKYADEDLGNNCGTWIDGDLIYPDTDREAFDMACEIWGYDDAEEIEEMWESFH